MWLGVVALSLSLLIVFFYALDYVSICSVFVCGGTESK